MAEQRRLRRLVAGRLALRRPPPVPTRDFVRLTSVVDTREHRVPEDAYARAMIAHIGECDAVCSHRVLMTAFVSPAGRPCLDCAAAVPDACTW